MSNAREIELGELMPQEGRSSVNPADYPGEVFELLSIPAYDRGSPEIALGSEIGSTKQAVQPGDVLLSKIVPHIRRAWVVERSAGSRQIASSEWIVFRSKEADARYLRHFLVSDGFHRQFMQTVSGVGGSLLRARPKYVAKIKIPLPPMEEQRRIAAILDKASNLKDMTRGLNGKFELLLRSIFLRLFGNPVTNEMGWKSGSVGELFDLINGRAFKTSEWSATGLPIIRIANVRRPSEPYNFFNGTWDQKHLVQDGDILLCWAGQLVSIGVHRWSRGEGLLNQHIFKVVPKVNCDPDFIAYSLGMVIERAKSNFRGIEMKHLTKEDLDREGMIIPPLELQEKFGDIARSIERLRENCQSQLRRSEELAASIASGSFEHLLSSQLVK